jgi:hypothetical protein
MHGPLHGIIHASDEKPKITRDLLLRVLAYARPYVRALILLLCVILLSAAFL